MALSRSGSSVSVPAERLPVSNIATCWPTSAGIRRGSRKADIAHSSAPQMTICTTATSPTPNILPSIRWMGLTEETTSSSTRLFFSSMMEVMTSWPYISRNIYRRKVMNMPMPNERADEVASPAPVSSTRIVWRLTSTLVSSRICWRLLMS